MTNHLIEKTAQFIEQAVSEVKKKAALEVELGSCKTRLNSAEEALREYRSSLNKVASALMEADFICSREEREQFLKQAEHDPAYLSKVLFKVCRASDVSTFGAVSKAKGVAKYAEYDPVYARAFGYSQGTSSLIFEED